MPDEQPTIFDVAGQISRLLSSLPKDDQAKALRWVAESVDVALAPAASSAQSASPAPPAPLPSGTTPTHAEASSRPVDIKEFVGEKAPKSDNQYAAVVAYYYRFEAPEGQRTETIGADNLQEAARLAGRPRLGNPSTTLNNAVAQGYLNKVGRGSYSISTVGENLVALTLPSGSDTSTTPTRTTRKKSKKKAAKKTKKKTTKKTTKKATKKRPQK